MHFVSFHAFVKFSCNFQFGLVLFSKLLSHSRLSIYSHPIFCGINMCKRCTFEPKAVIMKLTLQMSILYLHKIAAMQADYDLTWFQEKTCFFLSTHS